MPVTLEAFCKNPGPVSKGGLNMGDIVKELNKLGLDTNGNRSELVQRLCKDVATDPVKDAHKTDYVRLNQDFALAHMNKTVLCFIFEAGKKVKDDRGEYFKIIGFTDDDEYDLDFEPPRPGSMLYPNPPLSLTPKKYIVLHKEGEMYPIVIQKNGDILKGGYSFNVAKELAVKSVVKRPIIAKIRAKVRPVVQDQVQVQVPVAASPLVFRNGLVLNKKTGKFVTVTGKIGKAIMKAAPNTVNPPGSQVQVQGAVQVQVTKFQGSGVTPKCILDSKTQLRDIQQKTVEYFNDRKALLVVHGTGMGKTLTALAAGQCYLAQNPANRVVVLTAASLVDNFKNAYEQYGSVDTSKYTVINFDNFMNKYKKSDKTIDKCECKHTLFIIDEAHTLKNYEGQKYNAAMECAKYSDKVLLLTATPYINSTCDFISIINLLHQKYIVGPSTARRIPKPDDPPIYKNTLTDELPLCSKSLSKLRPEELEQQLKIVERYLHGMVSFAEKPLGGDYPEFKIHSTIIPMNKTFELAFAKSITGETSLFSDPEKFYNGYRRAVNSIGASDFYNGKFDYLRSNILKPGVSGNLIFSNWLDFGVKVIEKFLKEQGITYAVVSGETPIKDRKTYVDQYNAGKINTLVISAAGGTGLDLKGTQNIVILDPVWNASQLDQIIGRGVRYKSHTHLPKSMQKVNIYLMTLVEKEFIDGPQKISRSGDYLLYKIIEKKREYGQIVEDRLKNISVI